MDKIDFIASNMEAIYSYIKENKNETNDVFLKKVGKLVDHINLEQLRLKDIELIESELEGLQKIADSMIHTQGETITLKQEVLDSRKEYIIILGIFAAIILSFVAGISFSNSALANIHQASIYRLIFIICLICLFIFNVIDHLFNLIKKIHFGKSETDDPWYLKTSKFNIIIVFILLMDFAVWFYVVVYRNFAA